MGARAVNSTPGAETKGHCCAIIKGQGQDENTLGAKQERRRLHLDWKGLRLTTARFSSNRKGYIFHSVRKASHFEVMNDE